MSSLSAFRHATNWWLALCLVMLALPVHAKRLALVMGNDNYVSVSKLQKAGNDADAMARELKSAGFAVTSHKDLNYRAMLKAIDAFAESITGGDEVVVFYAGHGVQIKTGAYLLPVDIEAENESQVERTSYGLNDLTERLAEAKPAFTLVMVDACRDNPMKVKGRTVGNTRGLNALEPPKGQMVVYSASRGQQALDRLSDNDSNPNGVFTREFITRMRTPGVKIDDLMRDVQDSVESLAKSVRHEQRPAVYNEARGNFYFYGPTTVQTQKGGDDAESQTWAAAQAANSVTAYQTYLDLFPNGRYIGPARIKLDTIKQSSAKLLPDTEADQWAEVKAAGTREYLEAYIAQYPKGKYVVLARAELKKLDDAEKVKAAKLALEAEQAKQREEQRVAAETRQAEEQRIKAELVKKADEVRVASEAKKEVGAAPGPTQAKKEVTFAHQDMLLPMRVLMDAELEKATGYKINWKMFSGGGAIIKAMGSGEVQIGEMGSSPLATAASIGLDVRLVYILDDLAASDQLIARNGSGINGWKDLVGKKVGTPFASTAHYSLMVGLRLEGIDAKSVNVMNLPPPAIAAAWERGDIDASFIWDPVLSKIKRNGKAIATSGDIGKKGYPTFDGLVVDAKWAAQNRDFVVAAIKAITKADAEYRANPAKWVVGSPQVKAIAKWTKADEKDVPDAMAAFVFPDTNAQLSNAWLGGGTAGGAAKTLENSAKLWKEIGKIQDVKPDYSAFVDASYLRDALK